MQVSQTMARGVRVANPEQSICDVAQMMVGCNVGALPVGEKDRLVGMITDYDIAIRVVARGKPPETKMREAMSAEVKYCFEDDVADVVENIGDLQLHHLPVTLARRPVSHASVRLLRT